MKLRKLRPFYSIVIGYSSLGYPTPLTCYRLSNEKQKKRERKKQKCGETHWMQCTREKCSAELSFGLHLSSSPARPWREKTNPLPMKQGAATSKRVTSRVGTPKFRSSVQDAGGWKTEMLRERGTSPCYLKHPATSCRVSSCEIGRTRDDGTAWDATGESQQKFERCRNTVGWWRIRGYRTELLSPAGRNLFSRTMRFHTIATSWRREN